MLDAVRPEPGGDVAAVTAVQVREVVERLVSVGQWKPPTNLRMRGSLGVPGSGAEQ